MLNTQDQIAEEVSGFYADLYGYIMFAYDWNRGALKNFDGPEYWVRSLSDDISNYIVKNSFDGYNPVDPIYVAVASGNGAAKSAFAGMITNWIMSTRPMSKITVTANTGAQLNTKTWPQIQKWTNLSVTSDWFNVQQEKMYHKDPKYRGQWETVAHTWSLSNTQASAGQHSREGSSVYIVDEASHVPEQIMEQFDGGLTDGEPFFILLGNCTNRAGRLFRAVFGDLRKTFISRSVDTRKCKYTNKALIQKWIEERGEDSDWVRSHIKGEAPSADDLQLIDSNTVQAARKRETPVQDNNTPLVMGLDFARGGAADNVITWRRGRDARSIPHRKIPGALTRDTTRMVTLIIQEIEDKNPDCVCGDAGNMGGPILDRIRQLKPGLPVIDVMFGSGSPEALDPEVKNGKKLARCGNMRAWIWLECKNWLATAAIEDDAQLETDLTGPYTYQSGQEGKMFLESKEDMEARGLASPDWGDSLCTTMVAPKYLTQKQKEKYVKKPEIRLQKRGPRGWMGY